MKYSINFERHYKKGRTNYLLWHDDNIFTTHKKALTFAMDMVEIWRKTEDELITFQIISH